MLGSARAGKPHHHSVAACRSARRIEHDAPAGQPSTHRPAGAMTGSTRGLT